MTRCRVLPVLWVLCLFSCTGYLRLALGSEISITYAQLLDDFELHTQGGDTKLSAESLVNSKTCSEGSSDLSLRLIVLNVPLVYNGQVGLSCACMKINNEGVQDIAGRQVSGLNCTSTSELTDPSISLVSHEESDLDDFMADAELIEWFKGEIESRKLALELVIPLEDKVEEFCRVSLLGFKNGLVAFPKLEPQHHSLIKLGMSLCVWFGKKSNYYFDHPAPVTEVLEGNLFNEEHVDYVDLGAEFDESKLFDWMTSSDDEESTRVPATQSESADDRDSDKKAPSESTFSLNPFLRLTYVYDKPYPRMFVRSNVPYTKSIVGLDRSIRRNYNSVAGKWQIINKAGYTRIKSENSILSLLGSKYNSVDKEASVLNKLKNIHFRWKHLTFNSGLREFLGCVVGIKNAIIMNADDVGVVDPTDHSFKKFPADLQFESVFDIISSKYFQFNESKFASNPCRHNGNIRNCLKLIRDKILDKSLNYILGNLLINIIYESWITYRSDLWYIISSLDAEEILPNYGFSSDVDLSIYNDLDPINTVFTRLFNVEPLKDDTTQDIISTLIQNLNNEDLETSSIEKDVFQFGIFSINPLLLDAFWKSFSRKHCRIVSDSAFVTWIGNKFTLNSSSKLLFESDGSYDDEHDFEITEKGGNSNKKEASIDDSSESRSWLLEPLPNYFDLVNPEIDIEYDYNHNSQGYELPEFYDYDQLHELYTNNNLVDEKQNAINRRNFLRSNYFSNANKRKWVSFIVRNVPFRDSTRRHLEFKCGIGSWPYKGGHVSWMGQYMCEVICISPFSVNKFDFSTFESYYSDDKTFVNSKGEKSNLYNRLVRNRMIGIEFETSYPHRCGIGYLGNEPGKTQTSVRGSVLLKLSLGFCIRHGFSLQWLSDNSFNIYTGIHYKYSQTLETGLTYYQRIGFDLSGFVEQKVYSNYTCSGVFLMERETASDDKTRPRPDMYGFTNQTIGCQVFLDPVVVTDGIKPHDLSLMRENYIGLIYNYRFGCDGMESENSLTNHCVNFYPFLEKVKVGSKYVCRFELEDKWKTINSMFPHVCKIGARIGDCQRAVRKSLPCNHKNKKNCELDAFFVENFVKPKNIELIYNHFGYISLMLMNGFINYSLGWSEAGVNAVKNLLSKFLSKSDLELIYNRGINDILKSRMSVFMDEYNARDDEVLDEIKDIFSHSGILLDVHTLPLFWKLVLFRIEDIPTFASGNYLFESNSERNKSLVNKIFRSRVNIEGKLASDSSPPKSSDKTPFGFGSSIPMYCPIAITYYWIDKYMWQMYRYPGSKLHERAPIDG